MSFGSYYGYSVVQEEIQQRVIAKLVLSNLNIDRTSSQQFCDYTIIVQAKRFPVHKSLLAVTSKYFSKLFNSGYKEKYSISVELTSLSANSVEKLLDYIYAFDVSITDDNVADLIAASDYLQVDIVLDKCCNHLIEKISRDNALSVWMLGSTYGLKDVISKAKSFVLKNYMFMLGHETLLQLKFEEMYSFLDLKPSFVISDVIYDLILKWVKQDVKKRENYIGKLITTVDLKKFSKYFYQKKVFNEDIIMNSLCCTKLIVSALHDSMHGDGYNFLFLGGKSFPQGICLYNQQQNQWLSLLTDGKIGKKAEILVNGNVIYLIDSYVMGDDIHHSHLIKTLEVTSSGIVSKNIYPNNAVDHCKKHREYPNIIDFGYAMHTEGNKKYLYVAGGCQDNGLDTDKAAKFDLSTCKWETIDSLNFYKHGLSLVSCNQELYAIGGQTPNGSPGKICLNLFESKWKVVADMCQQRSLGAFVTFDNEIYAIGGDCSWIQGEKTSSAEKYTSALNSWFEVSSLSKVNRVLSAFVHKNRIFAFGEECISNEVMQCYLELYDPDNDIWKVVQKFDACFCGSRMIPL